MLNPKIEKMLVDQMNFEFYSAYIYMSMVAYLESVDLQGFAHWMKIQVQEEMSHSLKFYNYIVERGGRPFFTAVPEPKKEWASVKEVFEDALHHELEVTRRINEIATTTIAENDHATRSFLNWYVDEQVEEESNAEQIIKKLKMINDNASALFLLDKELALRLFVMPVGVTI